MFEDRFENMIRQYDQALADRKVFVGLMRDLFPEDNKKANLIIDAFDLGIAEEIQKASEIDNAFAYRFVKQLEDDHGISRQNAEWAVSTWCVCYGKNVLQKACGITISTEVSMTKDTNAGKNDRQQRPARPYTRGILPVTIGVDTNGNDIIHDFAGTPHVLVCGHSGTGKTCFVQTVLTMMAKEHSVDEVGYVIFDSKSTDYLEFNRLPHLLVPVINDGKRFAGALAWAGEVTKKRYYLFAEKQVKDLDAYNRKSDEKLPHLFIVIDDLYNLLFTSSKDIMEPLKYLLVNGRQAGIHIVIVTSVPSSKVLQSEILANLPCRICFAVVSKADSRTIISVNGAEELDVPGHMIFKMQNCFIKCQAAYMSEDEIEDTIAELDDGSSWSDPSIDEWLNGRTPQSAAGPSNPLGAYDHMLPRAVEIVLGMGSCSVSMIQRTLKIGYSRSAQIVDQMEELGIVGPYEGAKPRSVLIDQDDWRELCIKLGFTPPAAASRTPKAGGKTKDPDPEDDHDYSKVEVIYADSTPNQTFPTSSADNSAGASSDTKQMPKSPLPFWLRLLRIVGILFVVSVIIGLISTAMEDRKSGPLPSPGSTKPVTAQTSAAEQSANVASAADKPDLVTTVIPAELVYDGSTQAEYDRFAKEYGLASVKREEDGTIVMSAESKMPQGDVGTLVAALSEQCGKSGYNHFESVTANEDGTVFTIVVNDIHINEKEKQAVTDLFLMAGLQAAQSGQDVENIRVETVNKLGNLISARNTNQ